MKLQIFFDKKVPKVDSNHAYLAVINLCFAHKKGYNYYLQVLLKERRYIKKKSSQVYQ